jgi:hypothetical protein
MTDIDAYNELRLAAAVNLISLINMIRFDSPGEQITLQAKYVVDDMVRAATQAQVDCLSKGLEQ